MADYGTLMIANLKPGRRDAVLDAGQRWASLNCRMLQNEEALAGLLVGSILEGRPIDRLSLPDAEPHAFARPVLAALRSRTKGCPAPTTSACPPTSGGLETTPACALPSR